MSKKVLKNNVSVRKQPHNTRKSQKRPEHDSAETITMSELARLAGVSRPAVTQWILKKEKQGICLSFLSGRTGRLVYANNPAVQAYIKNIRTSPAAKKETADKNSNLLSRLKYQVEKMRLTNAKERSKYIERDYVIGFFNELLNCEKAVFDDFTNELLHGLSEKLNRKFQLRETDKIREYIGKELKTAHTANKRTVDDYINANKSAGRERTPAAGDKIPIPDIKTLSCQEQAAVKTILKEALEAEKAAKLNLEIQVIRSEMLPRVSIKKIIGDIYTTWRVQILEIDGSAGDLIASIIGSAEIHLIKKAISDTSYKTVNRIKDYITGREGNDG